MGRPSFSIKTIRTPEGVGSKSPLLVVGKAVAGKATERNLIKRRMRAAARELGISPKKNNRLRIVAHPGAQKLSYKEIKEHFKILLNGTTL